MPTFVDERTSQQPVELSGGDPRREVSLDTRAALAGEALALGRVGANLCDRLGQRIDVALREDDSAA
jgi:hypothetical protein